ncbi:MAG: DnaD domain protein [Eubacteriales bacterium]|nr:DnaD domain protein [Eubacteriales bacterium]
MQIDENLKLIYSDTLVPDIFITEYLPSLSPLAVKLYVYSLILIKNKKVISEAELESRMGTDREGIKVALTELASYGIITFTERGFMIEDLKDNEIRKIFKPRTSADPDEIRPEKVRNEREKMMADISKTFFSGLMSPSWYYEIESWFDRYGFEAQVVYALFNECKRRKKLDSKAYISKVAANWSSHGVRTYDDLNKYSVTYDKIGVIGRKVGQKMRKKITEYDEEIIQKWVEKMAYDFDVIDIALRKTSKLANPNLEYSNKLLEEWFANGLKTASEVASYEADKSARYSRNRTSNAVERSSAAKSNVGNFKQRQYSGEYLEMMLDDLAVENIKSDDVEGKDGNDE